MFLKVAADTVSQSGTEGQDSNMDRTQFYLHTVLQVLQNTPHATLHGCQRFQSLGGSK